MERQFTIRLLCKLTAKEVDLIDWAFPAFRVLKTNHEIQIVADLRRVNNMIKWLEFHTPAIEDTLTCIKGFSFATRIGLNMGYQAL